MYLGRFILGDVVPLVTLAEAGGGLRVQPAGPASVSVYDADGDAVFTSLSPARDRGRQDGLFVLMFGLDARFSVGRYMVRASWADGTYCRQEVACFDVVAGGHADGCVVSHKYVSRPGGDGLVRKTDQGKRKIGRRPSP